MAQEEQVGLTNLLSSYQAFVTYQPLRTEVAAFDFIELSQTALVHLIPPRVSLDPLEEAKKVLALVGTREVAILMPGRKFDAVGTRFGQGGGWYDRFLAHVPREWLRIGFCFDDQFSPTPLPRQPWDQAMDYVVVVNRETGAVSLYSSEGGTPT